MIAFYMMGLGVGFSIGCGYLVNWVNNRLHPNRIVMLFLYLCAAAILAFLLVQQEAIVWVLTVIVSMGIATAYSTLLTIFSNQVGPDEQGWVMGVTNSIIALCFGISTLVIAVLSEYGANLPMIAAMVGIFASGLMMQFHKK